MPLSRRAVGALLFLVYAAFVATRLVAAPAHLLTWDSAELALGVTDFDLHLHQPHPPGYPVYLLLLRGAYALAPDFARAFVVVNLAAGALAIWGIYRLAREIYDTRAALFAAAAWVVSPVVWRWSELGETVVLASAAGAWIANLAWAARRGSAAALAGLGALACLSGGIRIELPLLFFPVALWAAWPFRRRPLALLAAAASAFAGAMAWLVPLAISAGGFGEYLGLLAETYRVASRPSAEGFWFDLGLNFDRLRRGILEGAGPLLLPPLLALGWALWRPGRRARFRAALGEPRVQLTALGILGCFGFYVFAYFHKSGHLLSGWVFVCVGTAGLLAMRHVALGALLLAACVAQFSILDLPELRRADAEIARVTQAARARGCATLMMLGSDVPFGFRHGIHYFPERTLLHYDEVPRPPAWHVHRPGERDRNEASIAGLEVRGCTLVAESPSLGRLAERCGGVEVAPRLREVMAAGSPPCLPLPAAP